MKKQKLPKISLKEQSSDTLFEEYAYSSKTRIKPFNHKISQSLQSTAVKEDSNIQYHIETLKKLLQYRQQNEAPVDTMGCDQLYDNSVDILSQKFQILVSIMLSIQTKDQTTSDVVRNMVKAQILKPQTLSKMKQQEVQNYIRRVNYHKTKAKNVIKAAQSFIDNGAPKTYQQVTKIPGVGIKVGTLYMKVAEGINQGIGTDTHVHRIVNKLQWINTKTPQQTQYKLRQVFPKQYWNDMNHALVGFGQTICEAKNPKCKECPIQKRCPASTIKKQ